MFGCFEAEPSVSSFPPIPLIPLIQKHYKRPKRKLPSATIALHQNLIWPHLVTKQRTIGSDSSAMHFYPPPRSRTTFRCRRTEPCKNSYKTSLSRYAVSPRKTWPHSCKARMLDRLIFHCGTTIRGRRSVTSNIRLLIKYITSRFLSPKICSTSHKTSG